MGTLAIDSGYTQLSLPLVEDGNDHWNCADEYTKRMYWSRDDGVVALFAPKGTHFEGHCWDEDGDFRGGDDYQGSFVVDSDFSRSVVQWEGKHNIRSRFLTKSRQFGR